MVLGARIPSGLSNSQTNILNADICMENVMIKNPIRQLRFSQNSESGIQWTELWKKFDKQGILDDRLLDVLWESVIEQKPGLLGLMKKFDLICERSALNYKVYTNN